MSLCLLPTLATLVRAVSESARDILKDLVNICMNTYKECAINNTGFPLGNFVGQIILITAHLKCLMYRYVLEIFVLAYVWRLCSHYQRNWWWPHVDGSTYVKKPLVSRGAIEGSLLQKSCLLIALFYEKCEMKFWSATRYKLKTNISHYLGTEYNVLIPNQNL